MGNKVKKIAAPIIITILFILLFAGIIGFLLWIKAVGEISGIVIALFIVFYSLPIIGIIIALIQRIREINGGEEDEASKY